MSLEFTLFTRPNGDQSVHEMTDISIEDETWFKANNIKVSLEETPIGNVVYSDYGNVDEDGEPVEHTYIVPKDEECIISMGKIRTELTKIMS